MITNIKYNVYFSKLEHFYFHQQQIILDEKSQNDF